MNDPETAFHFRLSPAELHWLAGAFGLTRLPLPEDPLRYMPISQREPELQKAIASLQSRGLISQSSASFQVDRLPAAVIQWLGSAKGMLSLDIHDQGGATRRVGVFSEQDASMSVSLEEGNYEFLFFPARNVVSDYVLNQLGVSSLDPGPAAAKYALSQPVTILRAAWTDPSLAARMLKVIGLKPKEIKSLLAWAESLDWIATLKHVQFEGGEAGSEQKAVLCGNKQKCWAIRMDKNFDKIVILSPINMEEAHLLITNLL